MRRMLMARLVPVSRFLPSSVSRNLPSASTRRDDHEEIVWPPQREHRIDQIVPRALLAQMHLEAVGEEGEEIEAVLPILLRAPRDSSSMSDRPELLSRRDPRELPSTRTAWRLEASIRPVLSSFSSTMRMTPSAARRSA